LSYKIVGILYDVYNELGSGHREYVYERAIASEFRKSGIKFAEQVPANLTYKGGIIGQYRFDFLVEGKIVLELKQGDRFSRKNFEQVTGYLQLKNLPLGILANFTSSGVVTKRVLNPENISKLVKD
jgi:GxxExxY protein